MKMFKYQSNPLDKEKILRNLTIDGEGIGLLSAIEIDWPLSRTFLLNLLSEFAKGKKDGWQLKDTVDILCTQQETRLFEALKDWGVDVTGVSLTVFIGYDQMTVLLRPFIIEWAVLSLFRNPAVYKIAKTDIFIIRKFLMTPFNQRLLAFQEWQNYWDLHRLDQDKAS